MGLIFKYSKFKKIIIFLVIQIKDYLSKIILILINNLKSIFKVLQRIL